MKKFSIFNLTSLALGFSFLYLPILLLIIFSFNQGKAVAVWSGFSVKWYQSLFQNQAFIDAAIITLKIGLISATLATILGIMASITLTRMGRFNGRTLFSSMINAPIIMPEVITGISLLLLFVAINIPRGFWTVVIAHTTLSMCYATIIVSARLKTFDISIEEAASDLGCTPIQSFILVTLPNILPAVISAWLLSFTLSLDDLVIASFTSGPNATTLPMKIYSQVRLGVTPEINALSTILVAFITISVIIVSLAGKQKKIKKTIEL